MVEVTDSVSSSGFACPFRMVEIALLTSLLVLMRTKAVQVCLDILGRRVLNPIYTQQGKLYATVWHAEHLLEFIATVRRSSGGLVVFHLGAAVSSQYKVGHLKRTVHF